MAGGATGTSRWRPYLVIAGLVASFSAVVLVGGSLLSFLHLPHQFLRDLGIAMLLLLALGLLVPRVGELLEKPFVRLGAKRQSGSTNGFVLGASLGLLFVPCAGPVLATITTVASTHRVGFASVLLTVAYALGTAVPLLGFALVARRTATGWKRLRNRTPLMRRVAGRVLGATALAILFNLTQPLQTSLPGFTSALENRIEGSAAAAKQLDALKGVHTKRFAARSDPAALLPDLGPAPDFTGITHWLNTPGDQPLILSSLRGKVVLVDFWTYSCINCQRTLPHVEGWYNTYKDAGFVVVGVHTPEFDFEHVVSNIRSSAAQLGVDYPIAVDNSYGTWNAYNNEYWPAEYLIDQRGHVRHTNFGEGDYGGTESAIRSLLHAGGVSRLPDTTTAANQTPTEAVTPETYLGYQRLADYAGSPVQPNAPAAYTFPASLPHNGLALAGQWTVGPEADAAGPGARLELSFRAEHVYLVLGGTGTVDVSVAGRHLSTVHVSGVPGLYTLVSSARAESGVLELDVSAGVSAYDFTFG